MSDSPAQSAFNDGIVTVYTHFVKLLEANEKRIDDRFNALKEAVASQHQASEQAVKLASDALTIRLAAHNDLQAALDEMARQMARKSDLDSGLSGLRAEIKATLTSLENDVRNLRESSLLTASKSDIRPLEDFRLALDTKADAKSVEAVGDAAQAAVKSAEFSRTLAFVGTGIGIAGFIVSLLKLIGG